MLATFKCYALAMSSFTAIPVGQGDAFLLVRADGKTLLVDGGRAPGIFPNQISNLATQIDVVVCTHADADHTDGLIGLLESAQVPVSEVWLPGRWCSRLEDLCINQFAFFHELYEEIRESSWRTLEEIAAEDLEIADDVDIDPMMIGGLLENHEPVEISALSKDFWLFLEFGWTWPADPKWRLWVEAIDTANRIRTVALAAHHHGARLRWFDFEEAKNGGPGGGEPFLRPLNSVELTKRQVLKKLSALRYLALSVANKESLVFFAPETECDSPVLFTADSDLASVTIPNSSRTMAATAPHHGSEANSGAYSAVTSVAKDVVWVRSDGNYKSRPGPSFLAEPRRFCTLCRNSDVPKQAVVLNNSTLGWSPNNGRLCTCR